MRQFLKEEREREARVKKGMSIKERKREIRMDGRGEMTI